MTFIIFVLLGSAFFSNTAAPSNFSPAAHTPSGVRQHSHEYGIISKVITCAMWILRLVWNLFFTIYGVVISTLRSMFDLPQPAPNSLSSASDDQNFCEAMQHPVNRAEVFARWRIFLFNIVVSNNFIGKMM